MCAGGEPGVCSTKLFRSLAAGSPPTVSGCQTGPPGTASPVSTMPWRKPCQRSRGGEPVEHETATRREETESPLTARHNHRRSTDQRRRDISAGSLSPLRRGQRPACRDRELCPPGEGGTDFPLERPGGTQGLGVQLEGHDLGGCIAAPLQLGHRRRSRGAGPGPPDCPSGTFHVSRFTNSRWRARRSPGGPASVSAGVNHLELIGRAVAGAGRKSACNITA